MSHTIDTSAAWVAIFSLAIFLVLVLLAIRAGARVYGWTRLFNGILLAFASTVGYVSWWNGLVPAFVASVGTYFITDSVLYAVGVYAVAGVAQWLWSRRPRRRG